MVGRGTLTPASQADSDALRSLGLGIGEIISADIKKIKNPQFNRLVHALGRMIAENVQEFEGRSDYHCIIKDLQREFMVCCEREIFKFGSGENQETFIRVVAQSLGKMDQAQFQDFYSQICHHVAKKYWPDLDADAVKKMAELMPE